MPGPSEVLESLSTIANATIWLAIAWHAVLLVALVAFLRGWRPTRRTAALLLVTPIASVAMAAAVFGNVFNTVVFGGLTVGLLYLALRMPEGRVERGADWQILLGHVFVGFGVLYPHFLESYPPLAYVIAAPFGSLPCPTLVALIGFTLLAGGFSKAWNLTLVFFAVFYGTVGVMQLGVWIDVMVVLSGLTLTYTAAHLMVAPPRVARSLR